MKLNVPFNTKARLLISEKEQESLRINGTGWDEFKASNKTEVRNKTMVVLGSGSYHVVYRNNRM